MGEVRYCVADTGEITVLVLETVTEPHDSALVTQIFLKILCLIKNYAILQIVVPPLPGKALKRQLPFRGDDGIYEEEFIEDRRKGLEVFINK